jgi:hypothetical protein
MSFWSQGILGVKKIICQWFKFFIFLKINKKQWTSYSYLCITQCSVCICTLLHQVQNIYLTNYGQNTWFWIFLTFSHEWKSRNATQSRGEKYNIYWVNFGQNTTFWTLFETMKVLAISAGHWDSKNKKIKNNGTIKCKKMI